MHSDLNDPVRLNRIWWETARYLESLTEAVRENKRVNEAANFGRWLQFTGIVEVLESHPQADPLPVDGAFVRKQLKELLFQCGELFRQGKADPKYAASDISEINRKLDILAAHLATLSPPVADATPAVATACAALRVSLGGDDLLLRSNQKIEETNGAERRAAPPAP